MRRAQLSLSLLEASVGVVLVLAVTGTLLLGAPAPPTERAALDRRADDALAVLAVADGDGTYPRLGRALRSPTAFERRRAGLRARLDAVLPPNVLYRLETPYGAVGFPRPDGAPTGRARRVRTAGEVTLWVWYA
ncbi:MAG: hypothetical protein ABEJ04_01625 [Halobacteriaceae archaeon]